MAGKFPSKEIYPLIEQMLANCLAWCEENPVEQPLAVSCEPESVVVEIVNVQAAE